MRKITINGVEIEVDENCEIIIDGTRVRVKAREESSERVTEHHHHHHHDHYGPLPSYPPFNPVFTPAPNLVPYSDPTMPTIICTGSNAFPNTGFIVSHSTSAPN